MVNRRYALATGQVHSFPDHAIFLSARFAETVLGQVIYIMKALKYINFVKFICKSDLFLILVPSS